MTSLVPYASSSDEDGKSSETAERAQSSRKRLKAFTDQSEEQIGEAGQEGRIYTSLGLSASRPIKGDWLCHVFVPVLPQSAVHQIMSKAHALLESKDGRVKATGDHHISITKPILVRSHERQEFLTSVRSAFTGAHREQRPARFSVAFSAFTSLPSEDRGRRYFAVEVGMGWQELHSLTSDLNDKLSTLHHRKYYEEARFHCSFAVSPSDISTRQSSLNEDAAHCNLLEKELGEKLRACTPAVVDQIGVATGSKIEYIRLSR